MDPRCLIWVNTTERWYMFRFITRDGIESLMGREAADLLADNDRIIFNGKWQAIKDYQYHPRWISVNVQTMWRSNCTQLAYFMPINRETVEWIHIAHKAMLRKRKDGQPFECRSDDDILTKILGYCAVLSPPDTDTERIECKD